MHKQVVPTKKRRGAQIKAYNKKSFSLQRKQSSKLLRNE